MFDHVAIGVSDLARSIAFYDAVLATLGHNRIWASEKTAGYGGNGGDELFAIGQAAHDNAMSSRRSHIAFSAADSKSVEAFYSAAMAHGAEDEGAPALCPEYGEGYFGGFVRDPDGYRLEAVCHLTTAAAS